MMSFEYECLSVFFDNRVYGETITIIDEDFSKSFPGNVYVM
jgi:hypothetical protein